MGQPRTDSRVPGSGAAGGAGGLTQEVLHGVGEATLVHGSTQASLLLGDADGRVREERGHLRALIQIPGEGRELRLDNRQLLRVLRHRVERGGVPAGEAVQLDGREAADLLHLTQVLHGEEHTHTAEGYDLGHGREAKRRRRPFEAKMTDRAGTGFGGATTAR